MTNSLTDSLKTGRSFDDKLYNYLKNESTEEKITFDDIYPVGSIVKNSIKEPTFKNGTWIMTGVYGVKYYDETPQSTNVKHKLEFNGLYVRDYVIIQNSTQTTLKWNYQSIFGNDNYTIHSIDGLFRSSTDSSKGFDGGVITNNNILLDVSFTALGGGTVSVSRDGDSSNCAVYLTVNINLTNEFSSNPESMFDGLTFEFKRIK